MQIDRGIFWVTRIGWSVQAVDPALTEALAESAAFNARMRP